MSAITTEPLPGSLSPSSNKTSTGAAFKRWAPLSPTRQGLLILVSTMGLTHPHNSGFNFMRSGSRTNASDAPTLSRNTPYSVTMSNCILNACKSHHKQTFHVADQQPYWLLHKGHSFNALSLINMSTIFSTVWTAYNRRLFLNCADVTTSPSLQWQLKFPKKWWSQVWTVQRMQNIHAIL